jgi:hypothetical protein
MSEIRRTESGLYIVGKAPDMNHERERKAGEETESTGSARPSSPSSLSSPSTRDLYDQVYGRDTPEPDSYGWVQWKGTNVCMDTHCVCGHHGHIDAEFFYHYRCPECGRKFAVGQVVTLIELTPEEVEVHKHEGTTFFSDTD